MQDLFAGTQPYLELKSRLLRNLNGTLQEVFMSFLFRRSLHPGESQERYEPFPIRSTLYPGQAATFPAASIRRCAPFAASAARRASLRAVRARNHRCRRQRLHRLHRLLGTADPWPSPAACHRCAAAKRSSTAPALARPPAREVELAELIREFVPSIEMVRLVNSGTEATMSAIARRARLHRPRSNRQI